MNRIIGLTGYMGAGKDAAAALLSMVGYHRRAFADLLRDEVSAYLQTPDESLSFRQLAEMPLELLRLLIACKQDLSVVERPKAVWAKPTAPAMRSILQLWGTEYRRKQDPEYWTKKALTNLPELTVLSDVRFPNECDAIRAAGGVIWRITRKFDNNGLPFGPTSDHVSERLQEKIQADAVIANDGTLMDLAFQLKLELAK